MKVWRLVALNLPPERRARIKDLPTLMCLTLFKVNEPIRLNVVLLKLFQNLLDEGAAIA